MKENKNIKEVQAPSFVFAKENYIIMIIGLVFLALGYILMIGGGTDDPNVFNEKEIFSFQRITLSPILLAIGFIIEIYAIMKRPKETKSQEKQD